MVWVSSSVYFHKRNETFYFSREVLSDLRHRFNNKKIEVSLRTKSEVKAAKSPAALSDRFERYLVDGEKMVQALAVSMLTIIYDYSLSL